MHSNGLLVVVATMIYDHEWRGAEVRRNFGVLTLSFQTFRRSMVGLEITIAIGGMIRWNSAVAIKIGSRQKLAS